MISNLKVDAEGNEAIVVEVEKLLHRLEMPGGVVGQVVQLKDKRYVSVELQNTEVKGTVLRKAKHLKNIPEYQVVYVRQDLTYI